MLLWPSHVISQGFSNRKACCADIVCNDFLDHRLRGLLLCCTIKYVTNVGTGWFHANKQSSCISRALSRIVRHASADFSSPPLRLNPNSTFLEDHDDGRQWACAVLRAAHDVLHQDGENDMTQADYSSEKQLPAGAAHLNEKMRLAVQVLDLHKSWILLTHLYELLPPAAGHASAATAAAAISVAAAILSPDSVASSHPPSASPLHSSARTTASTSPNMPYAVSEVPKPLHSATINQLHAPAFIYLLQHIAHLLKSRHSSCPDGIPVGVLQHSELPVMMPESLIPQSAFEPFVSTLSQLLYLQERQASSTASAAATSRQQSGSHASTSYPSHPVPFSSARGRKGSRQSSQTASELPARVRSVESKGGEKKKTEADSLLQPSQVVILMEAVLFSAVAGRRIGRTLTARSSTSSNCEAADTHLQQFEGQGRRGLVCDDPTAQAAAAAAAAAVHGGHMPDLPVTHPSFPPSVAAARNSGGIFPVRGFGFNRNSSYNGKQLPDGFKAPYALTSKLGPGVWWMIIRTLKVAEINVVPGGQETEAGARYCADDVQSRCMSSTGATRASRAGSDHADSDEPTAWSDVVAASMQLLQIQACLGVKPSKDLATKIANALETWLPTPCWPLGCHKYSRTTSGTHNIEAVLSHVEVTSSLPRTAESTALPTSNGLSISPSPYSYPSSASASARTSPLLPHHSYPNSAYASARTSPALPSCSVLLASLTGDLHCLGVEPSSRWISSVLSQIVMTNPTLNNVSLPHRSQSSDDTEDADWSSLHNVSSNSSHIKQHSPLTETARSGRNKAAAVTEAGSLELSVMRNHQEAAATTQHALHTHEARQKIVLLGGSTKRPALGATWRSRRRELKNILPAELHLELALAVNAMTAASKRPAHRSHSCIHDVVHPVLSVTHEAVLSTSLDRLHEVLVTTLCSIALRLSMELSEVAHSDGFAAASAPTSTPPATTYKQHLFQGCLRALQSKLQEACEAGISERSRNQEEGPAGINAGGRTHHGMDPAGSSTRTERHHLKGPEELTATARAGIKRRPSNVIRQSAGVVCTRRSSQEEAAAHATHSTSSPVTEAAPPPPVSYCSLLESELLLISNTLSKVRVSPRASIWQDLQTALTTAMAITPHHGAPSLSTTASEVVYSAHDDDDVTYCGQRRQQAHQALVPFLKERTAVEACRMMVQAAVPLGRPLVDALCDLLEPTVLLSASAEHPSQPYAFNGPRPAMHGNNVRDTSVSSRSEAADSLSCSSIPTSMRASLQGQLDSTPNPNSVAEIKQSEQQLSTLHPSIQHATYDHSLSMLPLDSRLQGTTLQPAPQLQPQHLQQQKSLLSHPVVMRPTPPRVEALLATTLSISSQQPVATVATDTQAMLANSNAAAVTAGGGGNATLRVMPGCEDALAARTDNNASHHLTAAAASSTSQHLAAVIAAGDLSATVRQQYGSTSSNIIAAAAAGNRHLDTLCRLAWVLASNRGPSPRRAFTAMLARAVASTLAAAQQQQQLLTARASSISGRKEVARALATCTWALGKMGAHLPEPQAEVLLRISEACMKILGPQELSDVAWGIAKLASSQEWQPGDVWLSSLCSQLSQITPHLAPQHLSHIMWALAKLNCKPRPQVMYGLMQRSAALMPRFDSDSLALMLYGLAGLGYRPPRSWIRSYLARSNELLHSHRKTYEPVYQPDLVRFSSEDSGSGQSKPAAFSRVVVWRASTSKRGNEGYGAKSLARTAWSLAALLGRVSLTGRKQLRQNTSRVRISSGSSSSYSARGGRVGKSSRSLDGALLVSPQWLNRFMRHCLGQLPECDAHDLTLLAVGLAVLGPTLTRGWLRKFQAAINRQPTSLDLQIQANMMWAWRKLRGRANLDSKSRTGRVVIRFRLLNRRTKT